MKKRFGMSHRRKENDQYETEEWQVNMKRNGRSKDRDNNWEMKRVNIRERNKELSDRKRKIDAQWLRNIDE
jgi:hypothetical protein